MPVCDCLNEGSMNRLKLIVKIPRLNDYNFMSMSDLDILNAILATIEGGEWDDKRGGPPASEKPPQIALPVGSVCLFTYSAPETRLNVIH